MHEGQYGQDDDRIAVRFVYTAKDGTEGSSPLLERRSELVTYIMNHKHTWKTWFLDYSVPARELAGR